MGHLPDLSEAGSRARKAQALVKALEIDLCEGRQALLRALASQTVAPALADRIAGQRALHLAHREDDRATWLAWLQKRADVYRFHLGEPQFAARVGELQAILQRLERERARVAGLSTDALLADRSLFGQDEAPFTFGY